MNLLIFLAAFAAAAASAALGSDLWAPSTVVLVWSLWWEHRVMVRKADEGRRVP